MSEHRYEEIYHYGLLDDIHNLFPEILYDNSIFPDSISNNNRLLMWFRYRVSQLFPQTYRVARLNYIQSQSEERATEYDAWVLARERGAAVASLNTIIESHLLLSAFDTMLMLPRMRRTPVIGGRRLDEFQLTRNFFDSVPVNATSAEIEAASDIMNSATVSADTICAICQEHDGSSMWRRLRNCDHYFHVECVDNWFNRNVHCPVCRADIRDTPRVSTPTNLPVELHSEPAASTPDQRTQP